LISKDRKGRNSQSIILTENSVELIEQSEIKLDPNFTSSVPRDFLASVSKEIRQNPGPGSYLKDQLLQDKMRALSFEVCQRYQMNPFGAGVPRFEYQKPPIKKSDQIINNGMISVKDKDVWEKRLAFQRTIELHKKLNDMRPNAVFSSTVKRESKSDVMNSTSADDRKTTTGATFKSMHRLSNHTKRSSIENNL